MAWNNASEIVVASDGQVYVAPSGTALPTTTLGALNAAFVGLGYTSEDGVTVTVTPTVEEYRAWQSRSPVRREKTQMEVQLSFSLMQWDEDTVPLAFGGGAISGSTPNWRYDLPSDSAALAENVIVFDSIDGSKHYRWVFGRINVVEAVESQYSRGGPSALPIAAKVLAGAGGASAGYFLTDDPAFAAGS